MNDEEVVSNENWSMRRERKMSSVPLNWERVLANQAEAHRQALASRDLDEARRSQPLKTSLEGGERERRGLIASLWHERHAVPRLSALLKLTDDQGECRPSSS